MLESIYLAFKGWPKELITVIVASLPIAELRVSIPLAIRTLKEPPLKSFLLSVLGNLLPVVPLLLFLELFAQRLRRFKLWRKFFDYFFERTRKKASLVQKYEALGLAIFVAIPLPMTGAWTGCMAASLFKIRFRYAFLAVSVGVVLAGIIVTLVTLAGQGIFFYLFLAH